MTTRVCSIEGCEVRHHSLGYCRKHYKAFSRYGDPLYVAQPGAALIGRYKDSPEDFWRHADCSDPVGCWPWLGSLKVGYGQITWKGKKGSLAHRVAVELTGRSIPPGWHVDHLCRNKPCVNPNHLEPVPPRINSLRHWATHTPSKDCRNGHPRSEYGYYLDGHLNCRKCRSEAHQRRRRQREVKAARWGDAA